MLNYTMKKSDVLLSIVIPVYNVEKYITRCLESICIAWQNGVEVILVDDGSTDKSSQICDSYAQKYCYISVVHQNNQGISAARNNGTKLACGEYVAYVDSDDWVDKEWICLLLNILRKKKYDIILFDFYFVNEGKAPQWIRYKSFEGIISKEQFLVDVAKDVIVQSYVWNKVAKRQLWLKNPFDEKIKCLEDYEMLCRLIKDAKTVYYLPKPLYYYWQRETSLIHGHDFFETWSSFQLSLKRANELGNHYKDATSVACCIQAYRVCRKYAEKRHLDNKKDTQKARKYLRQHFFYALKDKELSITWKIKFLFACIGIL